jgi:hypothetical protein
MLVVVVVECMVGHLVALEVQAVEVLVVIALQELELQAL